jgi:penicillin-insensitive murein endopeptidase
MHGSLEQGQVLPKKGSGYRIRSETLSRRARFGTAELVALVEDATHRVAGKKPGSVVVVGDLSGPRGGDIENHGSHCSGRDADFLFFVRNSKGKTVVNGEFVAMDANGFSTDPPMELKLDLERNWALIEALLTSKRASVQWIFVAEKVRELLLSYAEAQGASPRVLGMARQVMKQPGSKAHVDHFHVRIYCSADDKPRCVDTGPRWAWTR